ncbi:protein prenyltransferase alpha subunit repeat-containing protein 1 [Nelusetta ayraudi]|uniref:protein prenyltransferase alpha subunit repeat-containing protein 1 n=1 Tax=Nelusetta ayraudi TaxID=303726 RepID=UPI003F7010D9
MAESEEEVDVLVQRVVKDIANALKRNPNIDEIGVIPCPEARYNRSPIVLVENKLGVESWCVKFLLPYVHNKLLLYRQRKHWLDRDALVDITCTLLLLNPDFTTAWNVRKELLQCGVLNPEKDLYLGKLALTKFPKSPETWIHRRWVLQQILRRCSASRVQQQQQQQQDGGGGGGRSQQLSQQLAQTLHQEMKVCCDAACRYPSNYNAWSHRIWVLQHMARGNVKVLHDELSSMQLWVSMHVSDHSGFHYRQFLLKELIAELSQAPPPSSSCQAPSPASPLHQANGRQSQEAAEEEEQQQQQQQQQGCSSVLKLFHQEMALCSDLIQSYPGHEALWSHRRHVFYLWHHWRQDHGQQDGRRPDEGDAPDPDSPTAEAQSCVNGERHAMEVDGGGGGVLVAAAALPPDPRDSKRLRRGVLAGEPPTLAAAEHGFVHAVLDGCSHAEQRRFALEYRKWIDGVANQQP